MADAPDQLMLDFPLSYGAYSPDELWPNMLGLAHLYWPNGTASQHAAIAERLLTTYGVCMGAVACGFVDGVDFTIGNNCFIGANVMDAFDNIIGRYNEE